MAALSARCVPVLLGYVEVHCLRRERTVSVLVRATSGESGRQSSHLVVRFYNSLYVFKGDGVAQVLL